MNKQDQLLTDLDYLEQSGMTVDQLRSLHHWSERPESERRVTFAAVRDYFGRGRDMRSNNADFAERLHLVAQLRRGGIADMVSVALRVLPIHAV